MALVAMLNFKHREYLDKDLTNPLAQSAAELWLTKFFLRGQMRPFVKNFYFCQNVGFRAILLSPYMLETNQGL